MSKAMKVRAVGVRLGYAREGARNQAPDRGARPARGRTSRTLAAVLIGIAVGVAQAVESPPDLEGPLAVAGVDPPRGAAQALPEGEAITLLDPLRLRRPIAAITLQRLNEEAESAYRARDLSAAHRGFQQMLALDPSQAGAWFRLGTIHQQNGDLQAASDAYRRALIVVASAGADGDPSIRARALLNLALIAHWRARLALAELDRQPGDPDTQEQRLQVERDLRAVEERLRVQERRWPAGVTLARPAVKEGARAPGQGGRREAGADAARSAGGAAAVPAARSAMRPAGLAASAPERTTQATAEESLAVGSTSRTSGPVEQMRRGRVEHLQGLPASEADRQGAVGAEKVGPHKQNEAQNETPNQTRNQTRNEKQSELRSPRGAVLASAEAIEPPVSAQSASKEGRDAPRRP